jgi:hypothetical protein
LGIPYKKHFPEKAANNNRIEITKHSGLQRDNRGYVPSSNRISLTDQILDHSVHNPVYAQCAFKSAATHKVDEW